MKKQKRSQEKSLPLSLEWWAVPITMTRWEMAWKFGATVFIATILSEVLS